MYNFNNRGHKNNLISGSQYSSKVQVSIVKNINRRSFIKLKIVTLILSFYFATAQAHDNESYFALSVGSAAIDVDGYSQPWFKKYSVGTSFNGLTIEGSRIEIDPFEVVKETSSYITVDGFSIRGFKPINILERFYIAPGLGVFRWDAKAYQFNIKAGRESGYGLNALIIGSYRVTNNISTRLSYDYLQDISQSNIQKFSFGLVLNY